MDVMTDEMADAVRRGEVRDRMAFAGIAALVGCAAQGSTAGLLKMLENAARYFAVPPSRFDDLAAAAGFYYHRSSDCYLSKDAWLEARRQDEIWLH